MRKKIDVVGLCERHYSD